MRTVMAVGAVLVVAGCGGAKVQLGGDADAGAHDATTKAPTTDGGSGSKHHDAGGTSSARYQEAGGYIDIGYYHGDGAFFVDGGA